MLSEFKGCDDIHGSFKKKYAGRWYYEEISRKHRYIYIHGSHKFKRLVLQSLKYKIRPYPKHGQTIQELEESFKDADSIEDSVNIAQLSSKNFEDLIV